MMAPLGVTTNWTETGREWGELGREEKWAKRTASRLGNWDTIRPISEVSISWEVRTRFLSRTSRVAL